MMNRREAIKTSLMGGALIAGSAATVTMMEGCTAPQWLTTLEADLPTLIQIATNFAGVISVGMGKGQLDQATATEISNIGGDVQQGLSAIQTLIADYNKAEASAKPGLLGQVISGINAVQGNLQALLNASHIANDQLRATVTGMISLIMATLLAIQTLLPPAPAPQPAPASVPRARVALSTANVRVKNSRNVDLHQVLVASYNEVVSANGYGKFVL